MKFLKKTRKKQFIKRFFLLGKKLHDIYTVGAQKKKYNSKENQDDPENKQKLSKPLTKRLENFL